MPDPQLELFTPLVGGGVARGTATVTGQAPAAAPAALAAVSGGGDGSVSLGTEPWLEASADPTLVALWAEGRRELARRAGEGNVARWLHDVRPVREGSGLRLDCGDRATLLVIERHLARDLADTLRALGHRGAVRFAVARRDADVSGPTEQRHGQDCQERREGRSPTTDGLASSAAAAQPARVGAAAGEPTAAATPDPRLRFDTFLVGDSNRFAFRAVQAALAQPGACYNPLVLHGGVGLGKTHLATAFATALEEALPGGVELTSSLRLAEGLLGAPTDGSHAARHAEALGREIPVLILEDFQLLSRAPRASAAIFAILDERIARGLQVILTCDQPPPAIPDLAVGLSSRLAGGLVAGILPPDDELRRQIVLDKARRRGVELHAGVATAIAERERHSVRALEGALNRVLALAAAHGEPVSMATVERAFQLRLRPVASAPGVGEIVAAVAAVTRVLPRAMVAGRRDRASVDARRIALFLARRHCGPSLSTLAQELGFRDHSAAAHAYAAIVDRLRDDLDLRARVTEVARRLGLPAELPRADRRVPDAGG